MAIERLLFAAVTCLLMLTATAAGAEPATYDYDAAGRLTLENVGRLWIAYGYDANGTLLTRAGCEGDCYIDAVCYQTAEASADDPCQVCDPTADRRVWTLDAAIEGCGGDVDMGGMPPDMGSTGGEDVGNAGTGNGGGSDTGSGNDADDGDGGGAEGGCKCSQSGGAADPSWLFVFALVAMRRPRRRNHLGDRARSAGFLALLTVLLLPSAASAVTVCKDGTCDYMSIREGISNSSPGETIVVKPDTYQESGLALVQGRQLVSTSPDTPGVIIDAQGQGPVFTSASNATFRGITFRNGHSATQGGGVHPTGGSILMENVVFEDNVADWPGGAIGSNTGSIRLTIRNGVFRNNTGRSGGAIMGHFDALVLVDCLFDGNKAQHDAVGRGGAGGAITADGSYHFIDNTTFQNNSAIGPGPIYGRGGALILDAWNIHIRNSTISGNMVNDGPTPGYGGGAALGGYMTRYALLENVTIDGNTGGRGSGVYLSSIEATFSGVTITNNSGAAVGEGGGIYCRGPSTIGGFSGTISQNSADDLSTGCVACTVGSTQSCDTRLPGVCDTGTQTCGQYGIWEACVPNVMPAAREQMCMDALDEDCDGATDTEDYDCKYAWPGTRGQLGQSGEKGDPVNTFTGEFFTRLEPDIRLLGPLPIEFRRYYASGLEGLGLSGALGANWRHGFEWAYDNDVAGKIFFTTAEGRTLEFVPLNAGWVLQDPADEAFEYYETRLGPTLYDPRTGLRRTFDRFEQLVRVEDDAGNALTLTYASGTLSTVSDEFGHTLQFTYTNGLLTSVSDGTRTVTFTQTGTDLTEVTDVMGGTTTYAYAPGGLLTSMTLPAGNTPLMQQYGADGRVTSQTEGGNTTTFTYDDVFYLSTITDPLGNISVHQYDISGRLLGVTRPSGESLAMTYGPSGRRAAVSDAAGATTSRDFDRQTGFQKQTTLSDGRTITYDFVQRVDGQDLRTEIGAIHYPDGTSEHFAYDTDGNVVEVMGRDGNTVLMEYDERGRLVSDTNEAGAVTTYTYGTNGAVETMTDPFGNVTTYGYDAQNRQTSVVHADGSTRAMTYDDADRLTSVTDERGNTSTYEYNANGNLVAIVSRDDTRTTFSYDDLDRLVGRTDAAGNPSIVAYDTAGRLASITDRNGNAFTYEYDVDGRRTAMVDAAGERWERGYVGGRLASLTNPLGGTTEFAYDAAGRLVSYTTPSGAMATVAYDEMGRVTSEVGFDGETTTYAYDALGNVTRVEAPGGATVSYANNALGLPTSITDPVGEVWTFTYDEAGRLTGWGDPEGNTTTVSLDAVGQAAGYTLPGLGTVTVSYDGLGNIISQSYSDGLSLAFTWDPLNRLLATDGLTLVRDPNGRVVDSNGIAMTRDAGGRLVTVNYPDGDVTYTYDSRDHVVQVDDWLGNTTTFAYDAAGRRTSVVHPNGVVTAFTYDADGAITAVTETSAGTALSDIQLQRDVGGNIVAATRDVPTLPELPSDGVFAAGLGGRIGGATYDALGRLASDGTRTYEWDAASRLLGHDDGANAVTYTHNGLFQVTSRTEGGVTTGYVWNHGTSNPSIPVITVNGAEAAYNVYTPTGELLYRVDAASGAVSHYHFDEVGNTLFLTDSSGTVTDSYAYTAFGSMTSSGTTDNPFTYSGRYSVIRDGDSGMYIMGRRFYDSASQRFLSPEPVREFDHPKRLNLYAYAYGNPLRFVDPFGETPVDPTEDEREVLAVGKKVLAVASTAAEDVKNATELIGKVAPDLSPETAESLTKYADRADKVGNVLGGVGGSATLLEATLSIVKDGDPLSEEGLTEAAQGLAPSATEIVVREGFKKGLAKKAGEELADKAAGAIGKSAGRVVGVGIEAYKMHQKVKEKMKELRSGLRSDLANYYLITDLIWESYRKKLISYEELERRIVEAKEAFEMSRDGTYRAGRTNVKIELLRGLQAMLESLL